MTKRGPDRYGAERAIKASDLPAPSRLLLFTLLTHVTNGTMTVPAKFSPSLSTLAQETGLSRRAVAGHLDILESQHWLGRNRPTKRQAQVQKVTTGYELMIPEEFWASAPDALVQEMHQPQSESGFTEPQVAASAPDALVQEVHRASAGGAHNPTYRPTSSSSSKKKGGAGGNSARTQSGEHPRFAEWYAAYPQHRGRGAAVRKFSEAVKKATVDELITAAKKYRDDPIVRRGFIKDPATWLHQECWLDDAAEPMAADGYRPYRNPTDQSIYDEDF